MRAHVRDQLAAQLVYAWAVERVGGLREVTWGLPRVPGHGRDPTSSYPVGAMGEQPPPVARPAEAGEGVAWGRLENQLTWYERRSRHHQLWYQCLKVAQIVVAAAIPASVAAGAGAAVAGALGAVIVVLEGLQQLFQFQQNWSAIAHGGGPQAREVPLSRVGRPYAGSDSPTPPWPSAWRVVVRRRRPGRSSALERGTRVSDGSPRPASSSATAVARRRAMRGGSTTAWSSTSVRSRVHGRDHGAGGRLRGDDPGGRRLVRRARGPYRDGG